MILKHIYLISKNLEHFLFVYISVCVCVCFHTCIHVLYTEAKGCIGCLEVGNYRNLDSNAVLFQ